MQSIALTMPLVMAHSALVSTVRRSALLIRPTASVHRKFDSPTSTPASSAEVRWVRRENTASMMGPETMLISTTENIVTENRPLLASVSSEAMKPSAMLMYSAARWSNSSATSISPSDMGMV